MAIVYHSNDRIRPMSLDTLRLSQVVRQLSAVRLCGVQCVPALRAVIKGATVVEPGSNVSHAYIAENIPAYYVNQISQHPRPAFLDSGQTIAYRDPPELDDFRRLLGRRSQSRIARLSVSHLVPPIL
jgi:hypothetical protein